MRSRTTQDKILADVVTRLIAEIPELNDQNCWLSDQPVPITIPGGRYAVTVTMGGGRFPHEFWASGGTDTLTEDGSLIVTPLVVSTIDRPRRKWKKISGGDNSANRVPSLLYFKHAILSALLGGGWEPAEDGVPLLRDMMAPLSADSPRDVAVGETIAAATQITFSTVFDWDVT